MHNNTLIYMITPTTANIASGGTLPLTTIARRRGKCITSTTDSILLSEPGYYKVNATITFTVPVAGDVAIELTKDSVAVPGITASATVTTATTEINTLALSGIVRIPCCGEAISLSLVNTGVAITTSNISFDVEYA